MSIKRYMIARGNAALEDLEIAESQLEVTPAEVTLHEEIATVTEMAVDTVEEVDVQLSELEEATDALEETTNFEEKIDALTELVNDDAQDIDHVTELVAGQLEVATEMFTARYGVTFENAIKKLGVAKESLNGSVDDRRMKLRASLEDAKTKSGGFKKWLKETIDKIIKWLSGFWTRHMTDLGRAGKSLETALKKIEAMKGEFPSAGVKSEAPNSVKKCLGWIDNDITTATAKEARRQYSVLLNESPKLLKSLEKNLEGSDDVYNGPLKKYDYENPGVNGLVVSASPWENTQIISLTLLPVQMLEGEFTLTAPNKSETIGLIKGALSMVEESKKFSKAMSEASTSVSKIQGSEEEEDKKLRTFVKGISDVVSKTTKIAVHASSGYLRTVLQMANAGMVEQPASTEEVDK